MTADTLVARRVDTPADQLYSAHCVLVAVPPPEVPMLILPGTVVVVVVVVVVGSEQNRGVRTLWNATIAPDWSNARSETS